MTEKPGHDDLGPAPVRGCRNRSLRRRAYEVKTIPFAYSNLGAICFTKDLSWASFGSVFMEGSGKLALASLNDR